MRLSRWARATLLIGFILLSLGVLPLWLATLLLPGDPPLLFSMAFFMLAPLGAVIFVFGLLLFVIAVIRS
ncbi:MAG TPA: hypothetical protein ENJ90_01045 [Devosia sp.]|nr:hypothetical protein [Devosia sp.]